MNTIQRHRPARRRRLPRALAASAAIAIAIAGPALAKVDLEGTWFLLVHYKDGATSKPDALRWKDGVWIFEEASAGLEWTQYPLVVLPDNSGRFERQSNGGLGRVLGAWEPNHSQLESLLIGPRVNSRGRQAKVLEGSAEKGWRSRSRQRAQSANTISYEETWMIEGTLDRPIFLRGENFSGGVDERSGLTRYEVQEVSAKGDELRGVFARDEQTGTFRLFRCGRVQGLPTEGELTPNEKEWQRLQMEFQRIEQEEGQD